MMLIVIFLHYQVALRSFALITQIPDRVTRWFGAQSEGLGEEGDTTNVVGVLNRNAEDRMQQLGGASMMKKNDNREGTPGDGGGDGNGGVGGGGGPKKETRDDT